MTNRLPVISVPAAVRDGIHNVSEDSQPLIVSISDIHGYLEAARSALLLLTDHPEYDPIVETDAEGVRWAGNEYVLVFNGDLIDRGPASDAILQLVGRLLQQAPPGRIRVNLGNHEVMLLAPDIFNIADMYATTAGTERRKRFLQWLSDGAAIAAYQGYEVTYAHAGTNEPYDVQCVNDLVADVAVKLLDGIGTKRDRRVQAEVLKEAAEKLGTGRSRLGHGSQGLVWRKFRYLSADDPPQVVGHTRQDHPISKGNIHCQNVIPNNCDSPGGEAVFVESPSSLTSLIRQPDHGVIANQLTHYG